MRACREHAEIWGPTEWRFCALVQAREEAAAKLRHAAELRAQMQAAAARKQAAAEVAKQEGARAREATAVHLAVIEVSPQSLLINLRSLLLN